MIWLIDFLVKISFFDEIITSKILKYAEEENESGNLFYFELAPVINYLNSAGILEKHLDLIYKIVYNKDLEKDTRTTALKALIKVNPTKVLQHFYDHYEALIPAKGEHIFAEVLGGWKGGVVDKLEVKILKEGSDRAKEIIQNRINEKNKKEEEKIKNKVESTAILYPNSMN